MVPSSPPAKRTLHLLLPPDISSANDIKPLGRNYFITEGWDRTPEQLYLDSSHQCLINSANALSYRDRPIHEPGSQLASVCLLRLDSRDAKVQTLHHMGWHSDSGVRDLGWYFALFGLAIYVAKDRSLVLCVAALHSGRLHHEWDCLL